MTLYHEVVIPQTMQVKLPLITGRTAAERADSLLFCGIESTEFTIALSFFGSSSVEEIKLVFCAFRNSLSASSSRAARTSMAFVRVCSTSSKNLELKTKISTKADVLVR